MGATCNCCTISSWVNSHYGTHSIQMELRRGRRGEESLLERWSSVDRHRLAFVIIVAGPDTGLGTATVPGNFGPLEHHECSECRTMDSVVAETNRNKKCNATNAIGEDTWLAIVLLTLRGMLHQDRVIGATKDALVSRSVNKKSNVLC